MQQPQRPATACEIDLVPDAIRSWKRTPTLDPANRRRTVYALHLTVGFEPAHVTNHREARGNFRAGAYASVDDARHCSADRAAVTVASAIAGSRTIKREPSCGSLSTETSPP